jgi:subtilase family serine protease
MDLPGGTPPGLTLLSFNTRRHDGIDMNYLYAEPRYTLGNLVPLLGRSATWTYRADAPGPKTFEVKLWSENGGEVSVTKTVEVTAALANLAETAVAANPPAPFLAPSSTFTMNDTVQNFGEAASRSSTTRYYLSYDAVKNAGDRLLTGSRSVPALAPGALHSGTANVTIPAATPLDTYFLLACADDRSVVAESDESNNCVVAPGTVTVTRPDLVTDSVSAPPATIKRGTKLQVTDTARNLAAVPSSGSKTRYYLSLDGTRSADDRILSSSRSVPKLGAGAAHTGSVNVTIPAATPLNTYFLLACADGFTTVAETNESNNCLSSSTTVTITP